MPEQTAPVLILAPSGRDAAVAATILGEVGLVSTVCPDLDVLVSGLDRAAGAIVTEQALLHSDRRALADWIRQQPPWSDFPFVLLTSRSGAADAGLTELLGNVTVLERPFHPSVLVNAAGAWADPVADACGVRPLGVAPKRRTMVQLRVGHSGLRDLPLVDDSSGTFYFKGESARSIWLSPHDEIDSDPCDAAPEEIDVATAIDRFEQVVDWPVEAVERCWAGLRSFAPDRKPVYGFDTDVPSFFWCVGQGGFGIQTAPAASKLAASQLLGTEPDPMVSRIDPQPYLASRFAR